jgi:hypothetical protein
MVVSKLALLITNIGSTPLSRCFSNQGIKIPIRNDSPCKRNSNTIYSEETEQEKQEPPRTYTRLPIADFLSPDP